MSKESHKSKKQKPAYQGKLFTSVVVPVYNDPEGIRITLESLLVQDYPPELYEIIVVDNDSTDSTRSVVEDFVKKYPTRIKLLVEKDTQSSYAARNKGVFASKGKIIAFIDADMWADKDWLETLSKAFGGGDIEYVGCNIRIHPKKDTIFGLYNKVTGFPIGAYLAESHFAPTSCLAVRRDIFRKVGLFDSRLISGGDSEFGGRCWRNGVKQMFIKKIMLHHPARESFKSLMKKAFRIGRGQRQLVGFYPERFGRYKRSLKNIKLLIPLISFKTFRKGIRSNRSLSRNLILKESVAFYLIGICEKIFRNLGYFYEAPIGYKVRGYIFVLSERLTGYRTEKQIYKERHGYELDLKTPKSYTQKLVWRKIHDRNPLLPVVSDKYKVREYVKAVLGDEEAEKILVPLLYVTDDPETIPFDTLPEEYIIKTNHASARNIIVEKGNPVDREKTVRQFKEWLSRPWGFFNLEWAYRKIKPKILIEKLMREEDGQIPRDYKFLIFHGKCWFAQTDNDRFTDHTISFFDRDWNYLRVALRHERGSKIKRPKNYEKMRSLAEKLGENFDYIRVDLYEVNNKVYFGELTAYPGSGRGKFTPTSFDFELGSKWSLVPEYWKNGNYKAD